MITDVLPAPVVRLASRVKSHVQIGSASRHLRPLITTTSESLGYPTSSGTAKVVSAGSDRAVVLFPSPAGGAVLKVGWSARAKERIRVEAEMLLLLHDEARFDQWNHLVPQLVGQGESAEGTWLLQGLVQGTERQDRGTDRRLWCRAAA